MIAVVLVAAVFLNLAVQELPATYTSIDVTSQKLYSLTDTTTDLVRNLSEDVYIYILQSEDAEDTTLGQTLDRYQALSGHVHVEYRDPVTNPGFYQNYTDGNISMNSLIVESDKRYTVIDYADIYETEIDYNTYTSTVSYTHLDVYKRQSQGRCTGGAGGDRGRRRRAERSASPVAWKNGNSVMEMCIRDSCSYCSTR